MASVNDIGPEKANQLLASELKKIDKITPPSWASFVKTGHHKERPPENPDWWFIRAASILKNIYNHGPVGVSKMRSRYGGKKDRGRKPERFTKASGNIIRKIVQQLESAELVKNRILYANKIIDNPTKIYINPDCGLRTRSRETSFNKIKSLIDGAKLARESINK